ncbi:M10 family metallopeptidase [Paracoccus binzhouensis]|uniref:M10 family metallopeptidase n=1 Tax=Paracoccus binzhouensis TaxID=2796149 RepID=UPI0022B8647D|nr:M10 family metallopeptidase [Paracoccus binzhouensis]
MSLARFFDGIAPARPQTGAEADVVRAVRIEGADAPASTGTGYTIEVGDTFNGFLGTGDADWVRVQLQPGTYIITLDGRGSGGLYDPYLRVVNGAGFEVAVDDDGGSTGYNSRLILNVTRPGTYYLEAGSYADAYSGNYSLGIVARPPLRNFTMAEIAHQLTDGFWESVGSARRAFDAGQGDVLNVDLSALTDAGRRLANMALNAWEAVTGIRFNRNPGPDATIHITFDDDEAGAWSDSSRRSDGTILSSHVNVGTDWLSQNGIAFNGYSYQTYIHEIGHALGLGHAGNYNGSAVYGLDNHYLNDSWQASIMSYFDQEQNTSVNASEAYVVSPMIADILAVQDLYGPTAIRTGSNTYGEHTNAGAAYATIAAMLRNVNSRGDITFTIFDQGGVDLLDLAGDSHNQRISLAPGTVSNAYGLVGNISIAFGTLIENVQAGRGHDLVIGNWANNLLRGGAGNDTLRGNNGHDTLIGGPGQDRLEGGAGNDTYVVDARDGIAEAANAGLDTVRALVSMQLGAHLENLTLIADAVQHGTGNALANRLTGNAHANQLNGLLGHDSLFGLAGNDRLDGGHGNDWLDGGAGADVLIGGVGNDFYVTDGRDQLREAAGQGIDTVRALASMQLGAHLENLTLIANAVQNGTGNALANRLIGNGHANLLDGRLGNDSLFGLAGNDTLFGALGADSLHGGVGNDFLSGLAGNDTLFGGLGADHFAFHGGHDVIQDFRDDVDTLRIDDALWGGGARSMAQILSHASVVDSNTVFDFGNGNTLTLNGLSNIAALQNDLVVV